MRERNPRAGAWMGMLCALALLAGCGDNRSGTATAQAAAPTAHILATGNDAVPSARFVRLEAVTEVHGNAWTSVAEFNVLGADGMPLPRTGWSAVADSAEVSGENAPASHAIDGDPYSFWHTQWQGGSPTPPHALTVDLGATRAVTGFKYLPRQVGENGRIAAWRFYTSADGGQWTQVASGTFPNTDAEQTVTLAAVVNHAPVLAPVADRSDGIGLALTQALAATDADGDAVSYAANGLPPGLVLDTASGQVSGTPTGAGTFPVTVQASDGRGGTARIAFAWTITPAASVAATTARYVRLQALSEINGNPWASVAELNVLDASGNAIPRAGWVASADSQEVVGEQAPASQAIDGDAGSFWHTQWQGGSTPMPHALTVDMGVARAIGGFRYLPRQVGVNGRIAGWRFYTSTDGSAWTLFAQGTFDGSADEQSYRTTAAVAAPVTNGSPQTTARSARIAAFASGPLVAAPPWTAGESVPPETVRRLSGGANIFYSTGGTTGRTEPAVLDGRPAADGSAVGYLNGRTLAATRAEAPLVSASPSASAAGLREVDFAIGDFQPARYATAQGCRSISTGTAYLGHYCYANGPAAGSGNATAYAAGPYGAGLSNAYVYHANAWEEEFVVTDSVFGLVFWNSASPVNVEIDGVQVQAGPTPSSGAPGWTLTFDYRGASKARTVRVISAVGATVPALRGVALSAQGQVAAGRLPTDQMLVLGDSINATVVPSSEAGAQVMSYWVQRYLGFDGAINMAVGGSGYVSANANTFNLPDLLANPANQALLGSYAPSITHVVIGAGFNDRFRPVASVRASALQSWRLLRKLLPTAKITVTDGWSGSSGPDAAAVQLAAGLASAFAEWGDTNARLVHTTDYVQGTGNAGAPVTAGNSSYYTSIDAVHPSPAGARYLARRLADDIASAWGGAY